MIRIGYNVLFVSCLFMVSWNVDHPANAGPYSEIVVFGDSHSDLGNACTLFAPPDPECIGLRYSNGPLWVEELAFQLNVPPLTASVQGGLNFAFGGARTGIGSDVYEGTAIPRIGAQVTQFLQRQTPSDDQLFVFLAGHNDWVWNPSVRATSVVQNLSAHISALAQAGARQFLVANLSPLGHAPYLRGTPRGASTNTAIEQYNDLLAVELDALQKRLSVTIHRVDLESLTTHAINDPLSIGLTNVLDQANGPGVTNPDEYLYWDFVHFTTAFHKVLGREAALAVMPAVPEPSNTAAFTALLLAIPILRITRIGRRRRSHSS
jgi:3-phytase